MSLELHLQLRKNRTTKKTKTVPNGTTVNDANEDDGVVMMVGEQLMDTAGLLVFFSDSKSNNVVL
jgi:hypothetical protein